MVEYNSVALKTEQMRRINLAILESGVKCG